MFMINRQVLKELTNMNLLRYVQVKDKLVVLMFICVISNILLGVFSIDYLRKMSWQATNTYEQALQPLVWLNEIEENHLALDKAADYNTSIPEASPAIKQWKALKMDNKIPLLAKQYEQGYKALQQTIASKTTATNWYSDVYMPLSEQTYAILRETNAHIIDTATAKREAYQKDIAFGYKLLGFVSFIVVILVIGMSIIATRAIHIPTQELQKLLKRAEQGDFSAMATYSARDELGEVMLSYNQMATQVQSLLATVQSTVTDVTMVADTLEHTTSTTAASTRQITECVKHIAQATQQSTEQLAVNEASLQEAEQGIEQIAVRMQDVASFADCTLEEANRGTAIVERNISQMKEIQFSAQKSNAVVQAMASRSLDIEKIVEVITALAEQTNLLALNAAIEAAHAGEHGKGFAIVADEVRHLAEKSIQSTKLITNLVRDIQHASQDSVIIMDEVVSAAEQGVVATTETAQKFTDIFKQVEGMKPHVTGVAQTVEEILQHTAEVAAAATTLTNFSQNNASYVVDVEKLTAEQMAQMQKLYQNAGTIAKVSKKLHHATARFVVKV